MTYTDAVIGNKKALSRARSLSKKESLRKEVYKKTGWMPPKTMSMQKIRMAVGI